MKVSSVPKAEVANNNLYEATGSRSQKMHRGKNFNSPFEFTLRLPTDRQTRLSIAMPNSVSPMFHQKGRRFGLFICKVLEQTNQ